MYTYTQHVTLCTLCMYFYVYPSRQQGQPSALASLFSQPSQLSCSGHLPTPTCLALRLQTLRQRKAQSQSRTARSTTFTEAKTTTDWSRRLSSGCARPQLSEQPPLTRLVLNLVRRGLFQLTSTELGKEGVVPTDWFRTDQLEQPPPYQVQN